MIQDSVYDEVMGRLMAIGSDEKAKELMQYFQCVPGGYGEGDRFFGIRVPDIRLAIKPISKAAPFEDLHWLLMEPWHEARLAALLLLKQRYLKSLRKGREESSACVDFYLSHTHRINNWDLVDLSATDILGHWLWDNDRSILYTLSKSDNLWEQRIAIISTLYFVRWEDYTDALRLAECYLTHSHDLIHKATGWILREVGKQNPDVLRKFIDKHCEQMPRTMLRYAIEKFPAEERQAILKRKRGFYWID